MNVASLELCKDLYELSGWIMPNSLGHQVRNEHGVGTEWWALYDLGYLLRKLAEVGAGVRYVLPEPYDAIDLTMKAWHGNFIATTPDRKFGGYPIASTPEDAATKLAIELFKQGVLTKEE